MHYKNILTILLISFTNFSFCQIQKNFYVEDADGVDFVRFKFCVSDSAKIYNAELIPEKSTYKNEYVINQLKDYLLSIEFYPESKLKNDCHKTTFTLINSKYENKQIDSLEISNDFPLLTGEYRYKNPFYSKTRIIRKKKVQREIATEEKQIYKIVWLSTTQYKLIYKRMTDKSLRKYIGKEIFVTILDMFPDGSYVYKATTEHFDWTTYGLMYKVK